MSTAKPSRTWSGSRKEEQAIQILFCSNEIEVVWVCFINSDKTFARKALTKASATPSFQRMLYILVALSRRLIILLWSEVGKNSPICTVLWKTVTSEMKIIFTLYFKTHGFLEFVGFLLFLLMVSIGMNVVLENLI